MIYDQETGISNVDWTVYGKIKTITKASGNGPSINYTYDSSGQRTTKLVSDVTTWYVRDASGNTMAIYDNKGGTTNWREQDLYGSSRLGMWSPNVNLADNNASTVWDTVGHKQYELTNHLGDVLATITDKRIPHNSDGTTIDYYNPETTTAQDYFAFGYQIPMRGYVLNGKLYRYGFNGKENDNEVKKDFDGNDIAGAQQDYGMRIYDPRVGRFLSVDPLSRTYSELTPYQFGSNNPIENIDLDGMEGVSAKRQPNGSFSVAQSSTYHYQRKPVLQVPMTDAEKSKIEMQRFAASQTVGYVVDKNGYGWPVTRSEADVLEQEYRNYLGDVTSSSPAASIGCWIAGEKGMSIGQIVGSVSMSASGIREPAYSGPVVSIELEPMSIRVPVNRGSWSGVAGYSEWRSTNPEVNKITNNEAIPFVNGKIVLDKWSIATFSVEGLNGTKKDFDLIYKKMAADFGFGSPSAAKMWLQKNNFTPHHGEGTTVQIVPTTLNKIPHAGGASELRNQ